MNDAIILATDKIVEETHVRLEHKRKDLGSPIQVHLARRVFKIFNHTHP